MSAVAHSTTSTRSFLTRFLTGCTLVATMSSAALADRAYDPPAVPATREAPVAPARRVVGGGVPAFAQPPHEASKPDDEYIAPVVLDRAAVRAELVKIRHRNLENFRAYEKAGVFPSNVYQPNELNVWRDQDGHFCAAATIIRMSGQTALVDRVAEQNNFIRLADVSQGPLMDWILTSGFTQEELVAIQKPFMPVTEKPVPAPIDPVVVDAKLRAAETARLRAIYHQVERDLVKNEKRDLDLATDRLMKHPDLAWKIASAE
jgi:hypothetical protein